MSLFGGAERGSGPGAPLRRPGQGPRGQAPRAAGAPRVTGSVGSGASILVVDDDTDLRETVGELLVDEGYRPRLCENGREALLALRGGERPRLILLDLMMPDMNGWQFREELLKDADLSRIPVVVMTASRGVETGPISAAEVLHKPIGLNELLRVVARNAR